MTIPAFLRFDPVKLRGRHDGWTPELQRRFILHLARGSPPAEAARRLGRSRQSAYALRRKPGAQGLAAAWDEAVEFSRQARVAGRALPQMDYGLETLLVPRYYRGRLVGFVQREDLREAMRKLAKLDRIAAAMGEDSGKLLFSDLSFDELVEKAVAESFQS